jgi:hypothetical protein
MMKKLILALLLVCFFATNAMAVYVQGTISQIRINDTGTTIVMEKAGGVLQAINVDPTLTTEEKNLLMAAALTAYSMGSTVVVSGPSSLIVNIQLK